METRLMRFVIAIVVTLLVSSFVSAEAPITVKHGPLDHATLYTEQISTDVPLHVYLFDIDGVKLGDAKHRDTAMLMASTVPSLLAVDIVEGLRENGFSKIILEGTTGTEVKLDQGEVALVGKITELNPGSQFVRLWIGYGAGKSRVCISGRLLDSDDKSLGEFSDCRSGLGFGKSTGTMKDSTDSIGVHVAQLLADWASGSYAHK